MRKIMSVVIVLMMLLPTLVLAEGLDLSSTEEAQPFNVIREGKWNENNKLLQRRLKILGYLNDKVDGVFGPKTLDALTRLQADLGLEPTGTVDTQEALDEIKALTRSNGVNLATQTEEAVTLTASGENYWCIPLNFYPTSEEGLALLADANNRWFTVSFDWTVTGADKDTEVKICLKHGEKTFGRVGVIAVPAGESSGHFKLCFVPTDMMRGVGTGWAIMGIGEGTVNRNIQITLSNFRFEAGIRPE